MLTPREFKTFLHFKSYIEMDLVFYVRVGACKKRVTGKQPLIKTCIVKRKVIRFSITLLSVYHEILDLYRFDYVDIDRV